MPELIYPLLSISRLRMETDGEGVTTLIAGAGCGLNCRWCINRSELQKKTEQVTAAELYERVKIDDLYFRATGGGVTFGGGESLLHADFISEFASLCRGHWKIYAETALFVPQSAVETAAACVDGFIVDIKTMNADIFRRYTGQDNAEIKDNLKKLTELVGAERIRVRVPLIPQFNDESDRKNTARELADMGITRIDFFNYVAREE